MYKPKQGKRKDQAPAITVPRTTTQVTYLNIPLVNYLKEREIDSLIFDVNKVDKEIKLRKPKAGEKSYRINRTGLRGYGVRDILRTRLPAGRYELVDRRSMTFAKKT